LEGGRTGGGNVDDLEGGGEKGQIEKPGKKIASGGVMRELWGKHETNKKLLGERERKQKRRGSREHGEMPW